MKKLLLFVIGTMLAFGAYGQSDLPTCQGSDTTKWRNCFGTYTTANGTKYVGQFKDGKEHGQGTDAYADGGKYIGQFKDGKYHGQGTRTYASGDKYVGEFKDDARHGQGTYTYASGDKYVGEFEDGKMHGQGTSTWANGQKYIGQFKDGKSHGRGVETYADGRPTKEGIWADDKFVRAEKIDTKTQAVTSEAASSSHCFSSTDEWVNSSSGREWRTIAEPFWQKLPEAEANPAAMDQIFLRDSMNIANSLVLKAKNIRFCKTNDQRKFDGGLSSLIEWRDRASELLRLWQNVETSYEKSIEGLNCPAYKEAQYKCATAGNPSYCIKVLFPAVNEMYANCR